MLSESGSARLAVHLPSNPPPRASRPGSASARILGQRPHSAGRRISPSEASEAPKPGYTKYTGELDVWVPCQEEQFAGEAVVDDIPAPSVHEITQVLSELRAGMASRKDLERLATEIKMEVKTEASALRQKLGAAVHQMAGETRVSRRLNCGLELAAELGGASADLKSLESSVAGVQRMLQDVISPKLTGFGEVAREVRAVSSTVREMQVREMQGSTPVVPEELRRLSADLSTLLETRTARDLGLCGWRASGHPDSLADSEGDTNHAAILAAIRETRTQILREFHDATEQHGTDLDRLAATVRGSSKLAVDIAALPVELQQLQTQVRTRVSGAVCEIKEGVVSELKSLATSTAADARELLAAVKESQAGLAVEFRQLQSQAELSRQQLLAAVQESRAAARTDLEELRARGAKALLSTNETADEPLAAYEKKALEAVATLGQELKELRSKSAEVLAAVQESKAERRSPDPEAVQESKAAGEHVSLARELQQARSQLELNAGELLAAAKSFQLQGGSVRELKELEAKVEQSSAEILEAVRESKAGDDPKRLLESIQQLRPDLERRPEAQLASVVGELRQQQSKMIADCSAVLQSITEGKLKVDLSPVLLAVRAVKPEVDFSQVLQAIHEAKKSVDFSPVLRAIHEHSPEVDLSPLLQAVRNSRSSPDVLRGLQELLLAVSELKEGRLQVDWAPVVKEVQRSESAVLSAMAEGRVDFSMITKKIEESRPKVDFQAEFSQLARALHRSEVDLLPVLEAIDETRTALDASRSLKDVRQLLREIREGNLELDWAPLVKELRAQCASGTSSVLAALEEVKAGSCTVAKVVEQGNRQVLSAIDERVIEAIREGNIAAGGAVLSTTQVDLSPAVRGSDTALESSQSISEIKQAVAELRKGQLDVDLSPVLCEVRQKQTQVEEQLLAVCKAVEKPPEVDFSPVLEAIGECSKNIREIAAVKGSAFDADLSPIFNEVRQHHAQVEEQMSLVRKAIGEARPQAAPGAVGAVVDLAPVLQAIGDVKCAAGAAQVELSPVLRAIDDVKSTLESVRARDIQEVRQCCESGFGEYSRELQQTREAVASMREGKLDVDFSTILSDIQQKHGQVEERFSAVCKAIEDGGYRDDPCLSGATKTSRVEADLSPVLDAIRDTQGKLDVEFSAILRDMQQKHGLVEERFSAVYRAIEDGKCRDDPCRSGATKTGRVEADLSPVLDAIKDTQGKLDVDFSPVLSEVQQRHREVEEHLSALRQAIIEVKDRVSEAKEGKPHTDLAHIVSDVQQVHAQVQAQLSAVRQAMEQGQLDAGSSAQVLKAVEASVAEVVSAIGTVTTAVALGADKPEAVMMKAMDSKLDSLLSKLDSVLRRPEEPRTRSLPRDPSPRRAPALVQQLVATCAPASLAS